MRKVLDTSEPAASACGEFPRPSPDELQIWMRLLSAVEGSVFWLLRDNDVALHNLRKEALARGIDPTRLIFAERMKRDEHLVRLGVADVFLDTLPYNAHTTASDALRVGVPLLTCRGATFPGRVAASLLTALGLPELATESLAEYEALALRLATNASVYASIKGTLALNCRTAPLFDSHRFCQHIETAYARMWEIHSRGESPQNFVVESIDSQKVV